MRKAVSIKRLGIIISFAVLFVSSISLVSILYVGDNLQEEVAEQQMQMYLNRVEMETEIENNNLFLTLNIARTWVNNGLLKENDFRELNSKFFSLIANIPQVTAISFVKSSGETYNLRYDSLNIESYYIENDSIETKQVLIIDKPNKYEFYGDSIIKKSVTSLPNYIKHKTVKYDSIVMYAIQDIPGMSGLAGICYSVTTLDTINNEVYTLTAYMSIKRIYNFLSALKLTETSEVHLFTANGQLFDFRKLNNIQNISASIEGYMVSWEEIKGTVLYEALQYWKSNGKSDSLNFFNFKYKKREYWAAFKPNKDAVNGIWTGLLMPEADFSFVMKGKLRFVLGVSIILLIVSIVFIIFSIKYFKEKNSLYSLSYEELQNLINSGENDFVEFKSTIRLNLHTNKAGKEIELAWLKSVVAFCNTEGGRILIGVKDDGNIFGLEADRFANDDKTLLHVQNLIKQHVGLEFIKYIHYSLRNIDRKKIIVISCEPISRPVFLRFNEKEQFFVRSGPASIELPVSKALEYINDRNNT